LNGVTRPDYREGEVSNYLNFSLSFLDIPYSKIGLVSYNLLIFDGKYFKLSFGLFCSYVIDS